MRQLVGFIAYLITGGQSATDRVRAGQDTLGFVYSNLAFQDGVGPLFDAVRAVFDPAETRTRTGTIGSGSATPMPETGSGSRRRDR